MQDHFDEILQCSHDIGALAGAEEVDVEHLEELIRQRDGLIRNYFAKPIEAGHEEKAAELIRAVLDSDAEACRNLRNQQQCLGEELGFIRRSHKAAGAYFTTEQD